MCDMEHNHYQQSAIT